MARVLINLPTQAKRGEIIEIKTLVAHPMETGYRLGPTGVAIPSPLLLVRLRQWGMHPANRR